MKVPVPITEGDDVQRKPMVFCWSGGKDSALALNRLRRQHQFDVVGLMTTVTDGFDRVSMHGVRRSLLRQQCASLGLRCREVVVPAWPSNTAYEVAMGRAFERLSREGVRHVGFGDIYLEDLRRYRDDMLARHGLTGVYPLWQVNPGELIEEFCDEGFRAVTVCVDPRRLDASFLGQDIDRAFVARLPPGVDACGEHGEYHSFVYDGPGFQSPVEFEAGEIVSRDAFLFCDLVPRETVPAGSGTDD